ncbi:MAG: sialate O-acetylesterase [Akkermansiaceae bacterium]|nr:sialate O-acetylesterase [Akkermansiaceae bacterium]
MIANRTISGGMAAVLMFPLGTLSMAQDNPSVNGLFSDHTVLQRGMPVPVWGAAKPGTKVTVQFGQQEKTTKAGKDGRWLVRLDAMKASAEPAPLTVKSITGDKPVTIADVLVGDVYLCSGQSNMEMQMRQIKAEDDVAKAEYPLIRHCNRSNGWTVCSPKTVGGFTATGFYFARRIHRETHVPIGLLNNAVGGTAIEPWTPLEGFNASPVLKKIELAKMGEYRQRMADTLPVLDAWLKTARATIPAGKEFPTQPQLPVPQRDVGYGTLFTLHTLPLIPFAIKGMIWYQGEANGPESGIYADKMNALISGLRMAWKQGDFPVYFVQLPNFSGQPNDLDLGDENFSGTRLAQFEALKSIPNTGMAVTIDTSDNGDLHPNNKRDVGERLAQWALVRDYGRNDLICSGPLYKGMKIEGRKIRVMFDYIGKGLFVGKKNGEEPVQEVPAEKLGCFALAITDPSKPKGLKWSWADAVIDGDTVVVSSPDIQTPVAVRYACICNPAGNKLYNKDGLPASPFAAEVLGN